MTTNVALVGGAHIHAPGFNTKLNDRHGKPAAAIVPVEVYGSWKRERQAFFDLVHQVQRKADLTTEEAQRLADQVGAAARAQGESIL